VNVSLVVNTDRQGVFLQQTHSVLMGNIVYGTQESNSDDILSAVTYVSSILKYSPVITKMNGSLCLIMLIDRGIPLTYTLTYQRGILCRTLKVLS
jgi:hypothetical protein